MNRFLSRSGYRYTSCLFVLLLTIPTSGCLFPPVDVVESEPGIDPQDPGGQPVPVFEQRTYQNTTTGNIDAGLANSQMEHGINLHPFDLPARLDAVRIILDWEDEVYDLDVAARLILDPDDPDEASWEDENRTGDVGAPDSPTFLGVTDRSRIAFDEPTQLRVSVLAKAGIDLEYTLTVRATYLVPAE